MGMSSMRDLLSGSAFGKPGIRRSISAAMIVESANRIIPGHLPAMKAFDVVAISFKNGILHLRVKSAAARHGVRGIEDELLKKLRQDFPGVQIFSVRVVLSKEPSRYELP